ncbi:MAG TPA: GTP-binding protein [Candidatus Thermoplasmatota archaeon]
MQALEFEKKILLLGDGSVGKTSLVRKFVIDKFDDKYIVTIGTKTSRKQLDLEYPAQQTTIKLQLAIWDILGQKDGFSRAHQVYFKGAESFILVYDRTNRASFDHVPDWLATLRGLCGNIPGVLAGNKSDLEGQFKVAESEERAWAESERMPLVYTSAKTGVNVEESFRRVGEFLCEKILAKYAAGPERAGEKKKGIFGRK